MIEDSDIESWKMLLKGVSFFADFDDDEITLVIKMGEIKKFGHHEYISKENSIASNLYVIIKGSVGIIKQYKKDRRKQLLNTLEEGDCIGEMAILLDGQRTASMLSMNETVVYVIDGLKIRDLPEKTQVKFYRNMGSSLAKKLKIYSSVPKEFM